MPNAPARIADRATFLGQNVEQARLTLPLKLLVTSIFLPDEVSFRVLGILLTPARLALLVLAPVAAGRLVSLWSTRHYRFVLSDILFPLTGLWMFWALSQTEDAHDAVPHAGISALEFSVAYLVTRSLLCDGRQVMGFINFLCIAIGVTGLLGLFDTFTNHYFMHELAIRISGGFPPETAGYRLGLLRAASTAEHPILFGTTCCFGLLLAVLVPIKARKFAIFSCTLGLLIALSAAPIQSFIIGIALFAYGKILAGAPFRWAALIGIAMVVCLFIVLVIKDPLNYIFFHLVFDAQSAFYRIYIWQVSTEAVRDSPWYGYGFVFPPQYDIPRTVDSVWLLKSLNFGVPGAVLIGASIVGAAWLPTDGRNVRLSVSESKLGTTLGILIFLTLFIGFTVDLFGNMSIMIPLLAGARARLGELGRSPGASNPSISSSPKRPLSQAGFESGLRARRSGARLALRSQRNFADGASR